MSATRRPATGPAGSELATRNRALRLFREALELAESLAAKGVPLRAAQQHLDSMESALKDREFSRALQHGLVAHALLQTLDQEWEARLRLRTEVSERLAGFREQVGALRASGADTSEVSEELTILERASLRARDSSRFQKILSACDVVSAALERCEAGWAQERREATACRVALDEARDRMEASWREAAGSLEDRLSAQLVAAERAYAGRRWKDVRRHLEVVLPTIVEVTESVARAERALSTVPIPEDPATALQPAQHALALPAPALARDDCAHMNTIGGGYRQTRTGRKALRICKDCGAHFTPDDGFKRMRYPREVIVTAVSLYRRDLPLRDIRDFLAKTHQIQVSETTILNWANKYGESI